MSTGHVVVPHRCVFWVVLSSGISAVVPPDSQQAAQKHTGCNEPTFLTGRAEVVFSSSQQPPGAAHSGPKHRHIQAHSSTFEHIRQFGVCSHTAKHEREWHIHCNRVLSVYVSASLGWHATVGKSIIIPHGVAYPVGQRVMHMCTYMSRYTCIHTCASLPRTNCEVLNQRHKDQTSSHDVSVLASSSHAAQERVIGSLMV